MGGGLVSLDKMAAAFLRMDRVFLAGDSNGVVLAGSSDGWFSVLAGNFGE